MIDSRLIEEASLNAWPALNTVVYDGWLLRFANGYTKRANSVTPLYAGKLPLPEKIAYCADLYRRQQQRPIFRLAHVHPAGELDTLLADAAYTQVDRTSVQGLVFGGRFVRAEGADAASLDAWLDVFHALNPARLDGVTHKAMLCQILGSICPLILSRGGEPVACGLAVVHGPFVGLFDIVTARAERRKGYGREVTESLLAWGQQQGATTAYLQVMLDNDPALALYKRLGFAELYRYWYRLAPNSD